MIVVGKEEVGKDYDTENAIITQSAAQFFTYAIT
jgi:hypothetical protein